MPVLPENQPPARPTRVGWPQEWSEALAADLHRLIHAVCELGGAIGWLTPPPRRDTDTWLRGVLADVAAGNAALCTVLDGDPGLDTSPDRAPTVALGLWRRHPAAVFTHLAELQKIMVHPGARGRDLGAVVVRELMGHARAAGLHTLQLGVRGNNHLAIELYERLGFTVWGRLPDVIEVGDERFDDVRMYAVLDRPEHLVLRGSSPGGPGSSPGRAAG